MLKNMLYYNYKTEGEIMKNIYEMGLHEEFCLNKTTSIIRVAGGWIYRIVSFYNEINYNTYHNVFVPYNNEFQKYHTKL